MKIPFSKHKPKIRVGTEQKGILWDSGPCVFIGACTQMHRCMCTFGTRWKRRVSAGVAALEESAQGLESTCRCLKVAERPRLLHFTSRRDAETVVEQEDLKRSRHTTRGWKNWVLIMAERVRGL